MAIHYRTFKDFDTSKDWCGCVVVDSSNERALGFNTIDAAISTISTRRGELGCAI